MLLIHHKKYFIFLILLLILSACGDASQLSGEDSERGENQVDVVSNESLSRISYGRISGLTSNSLYGVYYGDWDDNLINEVTGVTGKTKYDLVIVHPHTNITPSQVSRLKSAGTKVYCYLSVGEDDVLHTKAMTGGISGPEPGEASWYYDANGDKLADVNGDWGSYYVNVSNSYWHKALRTYTNTGDQQWYGYNYSINTLGCNGLFLDTVGTVAPAEWGGKYSAQLGDMVNLIAEIRANIPSDRGLIINGGLFYFDPYDATTNPWGLRETTKAMKDKVRSLISGLLFENFMDEWHRDDWAVKLNVEAAKSDGFTIFTLDYQPIDALTVCENTNDLYGWLPYVSQYSLDTFVHDVRDQCGY